MNGKVLFLNIEKLEVEKLEQNQKPLNEMKDVTFLRYMERPEL